MDPDMGASSTTPADACTAGNKRCRGDTLQTCNANGIGWFDEACPSGCNAAESKCRSCRPMLDRACADTLEALRTCDAGGNWVATPCPFGCNSQRTECNACKPNERTCTNGQPTVTTCDPEGKTRVTSACAMGVCQNNDCSDCTPGDPATCLGDMLRTCSPEGAPVYQSCDAARGGCNMVLRRCNVCKPSARVCDGPSLRTCSADGQSETTETCARGCNAELGRCRVCTPGERSCLGSTLRTCNADGMDYASTPCGEPGCNTGRNMCNFCRPNSRGCYDNRTVQICNPEGTAYLRQSPCPTPPANGSGRCDEGECVIGCNNNFHICPSADGDEGSARLVRKCFSNFDSSFTCGPRTCNPCPGWANKCNMAVCEEVFKDTTILARKCDPTSDGQGVDDTGQPFQHPDCDPSKIQGRTDRCVSLGCPEDTVECFNDPARMNASDPFARFFFCCDEGGRCVRRDPLF
jgi:hypothetical protein